MTDTTSGAPAPATEAPAAATDASAQPAEWEYSGRDSIGELVSDTAQEHFTQNTLQELASRENITIADLRSLPGTEELSDEQLQALWQEVQPQAPAPQAPPANAPAAVKRAWKAYNEQGEVSDFSKMTVDDFLKLQFEYTANGKQHRRDYEGLIRNASQGHYNHERMQTLTQERNQAHERYQQTVQQLNELNGHKSTWERALSAASRGDFNPLQTILDAFVKAQNEAPQAPPQQSPEHAQFAAQQQGQMVYERVVMPKAQEIAQRYNIPPNDVSQAILMLVNAEPAEFLSEQRLQQIMDVELPAIIEDMQHEHPPAPQQPDTRDQEIAELKRQLQEAKTSSAEQHNRTVEQVHQRRRISPPPARRTTSHGAIEPDFESAHDAREFLRNFKG